MNAETKTTDRLPLVRGRYTQNAPLGEVGWFAAGGTADVLYKPADADDLAHFFKNCPEEIPVTVVGVMSNIIVRDGGVRGVVIRLGREFNFIEHLDEATIRAGAAVLDANVADAAADAGITGMEFLSGIPGTIGGAVCMNAGSYGQDMKSALVSAGAVTRSGEVVTLTPDDLNMDYRRSEVPEGAVITSCILKGEKGDPDKIKARLAEIRAERESAQPVRERTGGSTFANPEGHKAWELIDRAGCRGLSVGGAKMSEKHCNFMINTGGASASDLEDLGEEVRRRVKEHSGIDLRWEIKRVGVR
jgi:UDP-N-acetylmuramate dehydrogenase